MVQRRDRLVDSGGQLPAGVSKVGGLGFGLATVVFFEDRRGWDEGLATLINLDSVAGRGFC
jgi:hypothetical protein